MRSWDQEPQTDQGTGQPEERLLKLGVAIQTTPQSAEGMQPGDGPLHEPTEHAQSTAVLGIPCGQDRGDPQPAQQLPQRLGVEAPVPLQPLRLTPLRPGLAADG